MAPVAFCFSATRLAPLYRIHQENFLAHIILLQMSCIPPHPPFHPHPPTVRDTASDCNAAGALRKCLMLSLHLQSSNVATYIAHGDVALSVLMTTASTLGAIVMTPLLTKTLAGALIAVDAVVSHFSQTHKTCSVFFIICRASSCCCSYILQAAAWHRRADESTVNQVANGVRVSRMISSLLSRHPAP